MVKFDFRKMALKHWQVLWNIDPTDSRSAAAVLGVIFELAVEDLENLPADLIVVVIDDFYQALKVEFPPERLR